LFAGARSSALRLYDPRLSALIAEMSIADRRAPPP
jgi:hypothetical protein